MAGPRKYSVNDSIFEKIDSNDKAYWLGFIQADGGIYKNTLSIELHPQDLIQLQKFVEFIDSNNTIEYRLNNFNKQYVRLRINSKKLINDLNQIGIIANKTYLHSNIIDNIPKDYIYDFYRGLIDGDGWITTHKNSYNHKITYEMGFCSTDKSILLKFKDLYSAGHIASKKNNMAFQLVISGNKNFVKLVELLGYNKFYSMPRKLELINSALNDLNNRTDGRTTRHQVS